MTPRSRAILCRAARVALSFTTCAVLAIFFAAGTVSADDIILDLPAPRVEGGLSLAEAVHTRRSVRRFREEPLSLEEISQLLWAGGGTGGGVTGATRTYPSAGGINPLVLYLVAGRIRGLEPGIYRYEPDRHGLSLVEAGDLRVDLSRAALGQRFVYQAPASLLMTARVKLTARRYGERGARRYVHMDAGHAAQNIYLQAVSLGLGTVAVGAFIDERVEDLLDLADETPLYIMPVGKPR